MSIALGDKLNLFETLASISSEESPATPDEVANILNLKPRYYLISFFAIRKLFRYVRELLCALACGEIIEVDKSGEKFWIKKEHQEIMIGPNKNKSFVKNSMFPSFGNVFHDIVGVFQKDGPYGKVAKKDNCPFSRFHSVDL